MSYTNSGFDKRVRNLLAALETAAPPPPPPGPPAGAFIRLRADDIVGADFEPIGFWEDLSGNNNNAVAIFAGLPVLILDSGVNGKKGLFFGGAENMNFPDPLVWDAVDGNWIVFVAVPVATGNLLNFGAGSPWTLFYDAGSGGEYAIFTGGVDFSAGDFAPGVGAEVDVAQNVGTDVPIWAKNGVVIGSTAQNTGSIPNPSTINLLGSFTGPAFFAFSLILEVIVYKRLPTAQDRADLIAYLADFYGL